MTPPTNPPTPPSPEDKKREGASARPAEDGRAQAKRPGGHGSYKLGGEPAVGHSWHQTPPPPSPPTATTTRFDDGVPHRHHEPGEEDLLHNVDVEHEHRDVDIKALIGSAIALAAVVLVSQLLMWLLFGFFEGQAAASDPQVSPLAAPPADMPTTTRESPYFNPSVGGPQLMTNEPMGLERQRSADEKRLHGYGWVNQSGGVAHIPIDEAKKLIRERGLPVREGEAVSPALGTRAPARGEASGGRMMVIGGEPSQAPREPAAPPQEKPRGDAPAAKPHGPGGH